MQTFVVKLASGVAALIASICLAVSNISDDTSNTVVELGTDSSVAVLRMTMTIIPIIGLLAAVFLFYKKYSLTDEKLEQITIAIKEKRGKEGQSVS